MPLSSNAERRDSLPPREHAWQAVQSQFAACVQDSSVDNKPFAGSEFPVTSSLATLCAADSWLVAAKGPSENRRTRNVLGIRRLMRSLLILANAVAVSAFVWPDLHSDARKAWIACGSFVVSEVIFQSLENNLSTSWRRLLDFAERNATLETAARMPSITSSVGSRGNHVHTPALQLYLCCNQTRHRAIRKTYSA